MKNPRLIFFLLVGVALLQLSAPGFMIWRAEQILHYGHVLKFQTEPVDPYDAFRGRYVALRFAQQQVALELYPEAQSGDQLYAETTPDEAGFSKITRLTKTATADVLPVTVEWAADKQIHLKFPFDRYYMEESLAPNAEDAYRQNNRRGQPSHVYATVRVFQGAAALEELYIDGLPILEFLQKPATGSPKN
jgi:uncharacterized membrane-anchored protein